MPFEFHTFGCKVNSYDSGLLEQQLAERDESVHVINTCAVTREATNEAIRKARRLKKHDPDSVVLVTGCSAQVDAEDFEGVADLVVANSHKGQINQLLDEYVEDAEFRIHRSNIFEIEDLGAGGGLKSDRTRSFLKIQDGCNSFCTYCVIPFARGKSRSIPMWQIIERINELASQGIKEVVLSGIHLGDYHDGEHGLEDLIEHVIRFTSGVRFRLSSLEPQELTDRILDCYQDDKMCPHFHMSIQSAEDEVLKLMKRQYGADDVVQILNKIERRLPEAFVGMDIIVGFPNETKERFEITTQRLMDTSWSKLHVFPYSERPKTYAARLKESIDPAVRKERSKILRHLSDVRMREKALKQVGRTKKVLKLNDHAISEDYWKVSCGQLREGFQRVRITSAEGIALQGVVI